MSNQTTLDLTDIEPTDTGDTATQVDSTEPAELVAAKELMAATLDAAKAAHPKYRFKDITTTVIGIDPGYAKEWRLIAGTLADIEHGRPVGWSRGDMLPDKMHVTYRDHHDGDGWDANASLRGRRIRKDRSLGADDPTAYLMTTGHLAQRQYSVEPDMDWVADWLAANRPAPYVQGDARKDVLTALYQAAEDCGSSSQAEMTLSVLDELTEKAGLIWVCGECGWRNPACRDECQCGQARLVPAAQPEGAADAG